MDKFKNYNVIKVFLSLSRIYLNLVIGSIFVINIQWANFFKDETLHLLEKYLNLMSV